MWRTSTFWAVFSTSSNGRNAARGFSLSQNIAATEFTRPPKALTSPSTLTQGGGALVYSRLVIWLFDLDNTLVDREAAFRAWAAGEVRAHDGDEADLAAIVAADEGGFSRKEDLAAVVRERLGWELTVAETVAAFRAGIRANIGAYPGVGQALDELRARGEKVAVVTNGVGHQQRGKLSLTGLDRMVDATVVSGEVGVAKPDPRMIVLALEALEAPHASGGSVWMIGDAVHADVAVGQAAGVRTAWISHGRPWSGSAERPDVVAESTLEAIEEIARRGAATP